MKHIYLDYAATTPIDKEVKKAMEPYFDARDNGFGNPNSLHYFGQKARGVIDLAREKIAQSIRAQFDEVIFTGSATEANNLALRGVVKYCQSQIANRKSISDKQLAISLPRIIISAIEHESILETAKDLEKEGVEVIILPVNKQGIIDLKKLKASLTENTVLVSVMYANNEIGTIQPITEIAKIVNDFKNSKLQAPNYKQILNSNSKIQNKNNFPLSTFHFPLFHTDAVQAFQFLNCNVNDLGVDPVTHTNVRYGVDLMTLSAHKIYGPKGIGALYINSKQITNLNYKTQNKKISDFDIRISDLPKVSPLVTGGAQEFGLRSGTENVPAIAGFAKAVELVTRDKQQVTKKIIKLKENFWKNLVKFYPAAEINGCLMSHVPCLALPNILNVYFPNHKAEDLLIKLDMAGVAVSSGSACASFSAKPSHVLAALGYSEGRIKSSIRFSFGKFTTKEELDKALKILKNILV